MLGELNARLFQRWRRRHVVVAMVLCSAYLALLSEVSLRVVGRFVTADSGDEIPIAGAMAFGLVGGWTGLVFVVARHRTLWRWLRDGGEPTPELWKSVCQVPNDAGIAAAVGSLSVSTPYLLIAVDMPEHLDRVIPLTALGIACFAALYRLAPAILLRLVLRPALEELASAARDWMPRDRIGWRVGAPVAWIAIGGGIVGAGSTVEPGDDLEGAVRAVGITAITIALLLVPFLVAVLDGLLSPIRALISGTERVRSADYRTPVPVESTDELGDLTRSFNDMLAGLRERASLHEAVGAYLDPAIADQLAASGVLIPGETVEVTVLFVDIVGFTTYAERLSSEDVVADLNRFFSLVIPCIEAEGGHANKLLGDGVMAVFGIPRRLAAHADHALAAARAIQASIDGTAWRVGVGLNSGPVSVGSMGGGGKLDYTIIGDAVNVAARIEAMTRVTGDGILLSDATAALLSNGDELVSRGVHALRGRESGVELFGAS